MIRFDSGATPTAPNNTALCNDGGSGCRGITDAQFLDWHCEWTFDDTDPVSGSATYTYGINLTQTKNAAIGPIAVHVYEVAGTYDATVNCRDSAGNTGSDTVSVIIDDADTIYPTTQTICATNVGSSPDFTGCPSGATKECTNVTDAACDIDSSGNDYKGLLDDHLGTGDVRILIKRGESWTVGAQKSLSGIDNVYLGVFPNDLTARQGGTKATVTRNSGANPSQFLMNNNDDWIVADLEFACTSCDTGAGSNGEPLWCSGNCPTTSSANTQFLWLRMDTTNWGHAYIGDSGLANADQDMFLVGPAWINGAGANNIAQTAVLGGGLLDYRLTDGYHQYRFACTRNLVINHVLTEDPWAGTSRDVTIRGCNGSTDPSYRIVISDGEYDNAIFVPSTDAAAPVHQVHLMLWERNHMRESLQSTAYNSVIRNNVVDWIGQGIEIRNPSNENRNYPGNYNVRVINNSIWKTNASGANGVNWIDEGGLNNECKENVFWGAESGDTGSPCNSIQSGTQPTISDNLDATPVTGGPFVGASPNTVADFALNNNNPGGAQARDQGVPLDGIFDQADQGCRDLVSTDWGALDHEASAAPCLSTPVSPVPVRMQGGGMRGGGF